jgi:Na+/H+ antiporter NhaD/arsenite permease-like protein
MAVAVAIFVIALAVIASERVDRTKVALLGATLIVLTQTIDQEHAIEAVDFNTIGLLAGMMLMVKLTETTGVYTWVAIRAGQLSKGRPLAVVAALAVTTAVLSAFLDNVTTVLLVVPITFLLADTLDVDPLPLVIIEIFASNIGGTATLIGDPPNILIAGHTGLSFGEFIANLAPIVIVTLMVVIPGLYFVFRSRLQIGRQARERMMQLDASRSIEDAAEAKRTVPILIVTILAFFVHKAIGVEPATVALAGASVMLLVTRQSVEDALSGIEWSTLFFLIGLFVMVGALEETGALNEVTQGIASVTDGQRTAELLGILWVSAIGSGLVDNIPFTAAMIPVVDSLGGDADDAYWWVLALGACFGGNATIVAAAANVAASGMAANSGRPIGFLYFLKYGIAVTAISLLLATGYVMVRYA